MSITFEWDTKVGTGGFAPQVSAFLDLAEATGVRHITLLRLLSHGAPPGGGRAEGGRAGPDRSFRADLLDCPPGLIHAALMRDFLVPGDRCEVDGASVDGAIAVPTGDDAEGLIDAEDIVAVVAATLAEPGEPHEGRGDGVTPLGAWGISHHRAVKRQAQAGLCGPGRCH